MSKNATSADYPQGSSLQRESNPSETIRRIPQISRNLAILLGLLYTDGCVSPKGNSWRIYFSNKSKSLIHLFQSSIIKSFHLDKRRVRIGRTTDGFLKAVVDSKEIGTYLVNTFGTFRTLRFNNSILPKSKIPNRELLESGYASIFLRVAFSCDGGVCFYPTNRNTNKKRWLIRTVFLACAHPTLRDDYHSLLRALGIEARNVANDEKIKIEDKVGIEKFYKVIGFIKGVKPTKHSKFWQEYDKQEVLSLMVTSYNNPEKFYYSPIFEVMI